MYLLALAILFSCKKKEDDTKPEIPVPDRAFVTEQDATNAALQMYTNIKSLNYYGRDYFELTEYPSDDITSKNSVNELDEFSWTAASTSNNITLENFWSNVLYGIFKSNLALEKVAVNRIDKNPKIPFANEEDRRKILAEAYFLRGLNYFNGACFFGGMPITTESKAYKSSKRNTREETFNQAILDLKNAIGEGSDATIKLPESWQSPYQSRATIYAGYALLGKIYLHAACYTRNAGYFSLSATYLKKVIDSQKFRLLPKYKDIFSSANEHNAESIFEIEYDVNPTGNGFYHDSTNNGKNTQRDLLFGVQKGGFGYGELIATQNWLLENEYGDPRVREFLYFTWDTLNITNASNTLKSSIYNSNQATAIKEVGINVAGSYFHVKKAVDGYEAAGPGGLNGVNNLRLIRYADVLLMYAEALNESGDPNGAVAYINLIRARARNSAPVVNGSSVFRSAQIIRTNRSNVYVGDFTGLYEETTIAGAKHAVDPTKDILADYPTQYGTYNFETIDLSTISKESVRQMIVRERRVELAFEYVRFLDMRRWEALDLVHPGAAALVFESKNAGNSLVGGNDKQPYNKGIHILFPIPQNQLGTLEQNPGY